MFTVVTNVPPVQVVDGERACGGAGSGDICEISFPASQYCCVPLTMLKIKSIK